MIKEFQKEYRWLSNFWPSTFVRPTVEHRYQASKTLDMMWISKIVNASTPGLAKRLGAKAPLRPDWHDIKEEVMYNLVKEKFEDFNLAAKLIATGNEEIQEGNWWGDTFWGVDLKTGKGENRLGKIIMKIRKDLRDVQKFVDDSSSTNSL